MNISLKLFISRALLPTLLIFSGLSFSAYAETITNYSATISTIKGDSSAELIDYYQNEYGVGIGSVIDFTILINEEMQGSKTSVNGEVIQYVDIPYGEKYFGYWEGEDYSYADLVYISIDENLFNQGLQEYNYSYKFKYLDQMAMSRADAYSINVGNHLKLHNGIDQWYGSGGKEEHINEYFWLTINDGSGAVTFQGEYPTIVTPVPAAVFYFVPSLLGLLFFRKKNK